MIEFLHPQFLYALPAVALPIVIHLLSRRRYRRVPWAAMDHLLRAERRVRRRLQWENLLLLAVRCAAVLLLVLVFAQPVLSRPLPGLAAGGTPAAVMLLDDSGSMAQLHDGASAFDRARQFALAVAERLAGTGADINVFVASEENPVFTATPLSPDDLPGLRERLDGLRPTATVFQPASRLPRLAASPAGRGRDFSLYVLTDLRAADWGAADLAPAVRQALDALQERGSVSVVDFGAEPGPNAGLTMLLAADRPIYARAHSALFAVVENDGPAALPAASLSVRLDGLPLPPVPTPEVPAGESREVPLDLFFDRPGDHALEVALPADDSFPLDDRRFVSLQALENLPVLIVPGGEGASPAESPAFYLEAALQPAGPAGAQAGAPGVHVDVQPASAGPPPDLSAYAAVFLADVASPVAWKESLLRYVTRGGRLIVFLGGRTDADAWSAALFGDGGLMPCALEGRTQTAPGAAFHFGRLDFSDPLLKPFSDWGGLFSMPRFSAFHRIRPLGPTRALARFDDPESSPAMLAVEAGEGLVILFAAGAGTEWSDWPRSEAGRVTYLSLMQWLVEYGRPAARTDLNLDEGRPGALPLAPSQFRTDARLLPPRGPDERSRSGGSQPLRVVSLEGRPGLWFVTPALNEAGVHELVLRGTDGSPSSVYFAVNVPSEERLMARTPHAPLVAAAKPAGRLQVLAYTDRAVEAVLHRPAAPANYWIAAAALAVFMLLVESVLACLFGNPAGAPAGTSSGRGTP